MNVWLFWLLVALTWLYRISAWRSFIRFLSTRPNTEPDWFPAISVLKPVKGVDHEALENFASFCSQQYPCFELLFGVADEQDPAVALVRRLRNRYPNVSIRLIVAPSTGCNPKSSILQCLTNAAQHDVLVISDSDIRVGPEYLRTVVGPLSDSRIGLVTCLFRSVDARGLAAKVSALGLNVDFLPSVVLAFRTFPLCMGIGATIAVRRQDLELIGGYAAIKDCLADDYQIARRLADKRRAIHFSSYLVTNVMGNEPARAQWHREVRWARNIRSLCPIGYYGSLIESSLFWCLVLLLAAGPAFSVLLALAATFTMRVLLARDIQKRLHVECPRRRLALLIPIRDLASVAVWATAAFGRSIVWRGRRYRLLANNRLSPDSTPVRPLGAFLIERLDRVLRCRQRIFEFSRDPHCILRLSLDRIRAPLTLANGTRLEMGETIGELHYWNEHLPRFGPQGPTLRWGREFRRDLLRSLAELARRSRTDCRIDCVRAFHARLPWRARGDPKRMSRLLRLLGAELKDIPPDRSWRGRIADCGERILFRLLLHAFNPFGKRPLRVRQEVWIGREALLSRFDQRRPDITRSPNRVWRRPVGESRRSLEDRSVSGKRWQ